MIIDTNILIACLNAETRAVQALSIWKQEGRALFISSISITEVLALGSLTPSEEEKIKAFLREFISIPLDDAIADIAGAVRRKHGIGTPDAIIVATALSRNIPLVTRDRQFRKIAEIALVEI